MLNYQRVVLFVLRNWLENGCSDVSTKQRRLSHKNLGNFEPWDPSFPQWLEVLPTVSACIDGHWAGRMDAALMSGCQNRQWESTKSHDSWGTRFLDVKNLLALDFYFAAWFLVKCSLGIPMKGAVSNQHSLLARSQLRSADSLAEFSEFSGAQSRPSVAMKGHEESRQGPVEPLVFGCWGFIPQRCISPTVQNRVK